MTPLTLNDLAVRFALARAQTLALERYVDLLDGWQLANVTGVRGKAAIIETLLGDSLALLDVPQARDKAGPAAAGGPAQWLDLGAGAGIPGIPLAICLPEVEITLLDSVRKKCDFAEAAVEATDLTHRAHVIWARSEQAAAAGKPTREAFDVVLARAVGSLATVAELASPLLTTGGLLVVVKSAHSLLTEDNAGRLAARKCCLAPCPPVPLTRSPLFDSVAVIYEKFAATPAGLPRREGLARSSPLA